MNKNGFALSLVLLILAFALDRVHKFAQVSWDCVSVGGALSNALDRLLYGAVADFFHFHWQDWSFYIFNVADAMITAGVLLLVLDVLGIGRPKATSTGA